VHATTLTLAAPAKINLALGVVGRRPDGFHEIESLVAQIPLCDRVTAIEAEDDGLTLTCAAAGVPTDERNLVLRAARELQRESGGRRGVHLCLEKCIPVGAGLGGGSSDAAATLRLLNTLWELRWSTARLGEIGARIGSDVALFFHEPVCVLRGRGELIEPCDLRLDGWLVLLTPDIVSPTPGVYAAWDKLNLQPPARGADRLGPLRSWRGSASGLMPLLFNDLEPAAFAVIPALAQVQARATELCGGAVRMTGSGAAFFRLVETEGEAQSCAVRLRQAGVRTEVLRLRC
jgi:4-diphosphocytidyl-2-C-methyl-D-erythritol kinase